MGGRDNVINGATLVTVKGRQAGTRKRVSLWVKFLEFWSWVCHY